jgi:hypothetical protein
MTMALTMLRKALHTLVAGLGAIYLILGASTRFSPDAMTLDLAAFIRVTAPLLIGMLWSAGILEVVREACGAGS